jgi:hypothetical protein
MAEFKKNIIGGVIKMKKEKAITIVAWHKGFLAKFAIMLLAASLIFMVTSCGQAAGTSDAEYPPPQNLNIEGFTGSGADRVVNLSWDEPDTKSKVIQYVTYKVDAGMAQNIESENEEETDKDMLNENAEEVARTTDTNYEYIIGDDDYCFYVTAIYEGGIESGPGNILCTGAGMDTPPAGSGTGENGGGSADTAEEKEESDLKTPDLDIIPSGPCGNLYYPVIPEASFTYQITGTVSGTQTHTITDIGEDGFTEEVVQDLAAHITYIYEWECLPKGLINTFSGTMITESDTVNTTSDGDGITIPASISVGDKWTQTCNLISSDGKGEGELHRALTYKRTAAAIETVTVPAGTFEAVRVDYDLEMDASMETYDGHSLPFDVDYSSGSEWYVEGVGLVKKTAGVDLDRMDTPEEPSVSIGFEASGVYELIEYSLP